MLQDTDAASVSPPTGPRLLGGHASDPRGVGARLDSALRAASCEHNGRTPRRARPVQVIGETRSLDTYRPWRRLQRMGLSGAHVPELQDGRWACVLWALPAPAVAAFTRGASCDLIGAPTVQTFPIGVEAEIGLATTLTTWLLRQHATVLAPPLLGPAGGPYEVASLQRSWPVRPAAPADLLDPLD